MSLTNDKKKCYYIAIDKLWNGYIGDNAVANINKMLLETWKQ